MERFARLFSASFLSASFAPTARAPLSFRQFREFGRLRHLRSLISCKAPKPADTPDLFNDLPILPSRQDGQIIEEIGGVGGLRCLAGD